MKKTKVEIHKPGNVRSIATLSIVELETERGISRLTVSRHGTGRASELLEAVTDSIEKSMRGDDAFDFADDAVDAFATWSSSPGNDSDKLRLAISLLKRCGGIIAERADGIENALNWTMAGKTNLETRLHAAQNLLREVEEIADETGPDKNWWRDTYLLSGEHAVLTEEGWMPAKSNTREETGADPMDVLDEVNAPPVLTPQQ